MASPLSPWPGVRDTFPFPNPESEPPEPVRVLSKPEEVLLGLREQTASGKLELDVLLSGIAVAAQAVTDADGAALGMRREGMVVCVGRSGETAPALGARLSEDSGISGECLRTGRTLQCNDAWNDPRVDTEVCRHLGLRSIVAVPLRSRLDTIGLLEVFSTSPHAFTSEHLSFLSGLTELADAAAATAPKNTKSLVDHLVPALDEEQIAQTPAASVLWGHAEPLEHPRSRAAFLRIAILVIIAAAGWWAWRARKNSIANQVVPSTIQQTADSEITIPNETVERSQPKRTAPRFAKPTARRPQIASNESGSVVPAAKFEPEAEIIVTRYPVTTSAAPTDSAKASTQETVSEPPSVEYDSSSHGSAVGEIAAISATVPKFGMRISEGVTPALLEHKINPVYPRAGMAMRLEGPVVLEVKIGVDGKVGEVKTTKGHPLLASAAADAVRKWRYQPAKLNGKPTASQAEITINFTLPRP